jgi:hypothetical protein
LAKIFSKSKHRSQVNLPWPFSFGRVGQEVSADPLLRQPVGRDPVPGRVDVAPAEHHYATLNDGNLMGDIYSHKTGNINSSTVGDARSFLLTHVENLLRNQLRINQSQLDLGCWRIVFHSL